MMGPGASRSYSILHTEASLGWGGQEQRIVAEAQIMVQRGHRLLIAADSRGALAVRAAKEGLTVLPLLCGGRHNVAALLTLRRWLRDYGIDILNTHSSLDSWLGALAISGRLRTRLVRTRHLSTPIRTNLPTRWLYQRADAIITTGAAIKTLIVQRAGVPAARVFSIPTGVPLARFSPQIPADRRRLPTSWPATAPIIGSVAVLRSWKGHLYLLEALHLLREAGVDARLVLVGAGPYGVVLEAKIAELRLQEQVYLAGHQDDVPAWLALMDIVVLASYANEGVPQSLLQAMAMAKPVVATRCGGIPEVVRTGSNGLLVPPRDSRALAAALRQLLGDAASRTRFGLQGRELVEASHSLEKMAQAVEEVYARVTL
ncbi:MAG: glycosyltransferase family 4 protein [Desulfobacca sp.]|uniref:glycosyltransferase family 4 protein n=1 Tax=Desulfobacca sp. TaxID=2067990 RepID=UPI00404A7A57